MSPRLVDENGRPYRRIIRRGTSVKARKVKEVYDLAHLAWRAGALSDFYYGQHSPENPAIVWRIDGHELDGKALAEAKALVNAALRRHRIQELKFGPSWCGYVGVEVTYDTGETIREQYNGHAVEIVSVTP